MAKSFITKFMLCVHSKSRRLRCTMAEKRKLLKSIRTIWRFSMRFSDYEHQTFFLTVKCLSLKVSQVQRSKYSKCWISFLTDFKQRVNFKISRIISRIIKKDRKCNFVLSNNWLWTWSLLCATDSKLQSKSLRRRIWSNWKSQFWYIASAV